MIYGILLESIRDGINKVHGDAAWKRIVQDLNFEHETFTTLGRYDEALIERIAECEKIWSNERRERDELIVVDPSFIFCFSSIGLAEILQEGGTDTYMQFFGQCFVTFFTNYGYDKILRVAGRHFRDFLLSIDQLHDSTRFSFPKMKSPLFHVTDEDENGAILHYK